MGGDDDEEQKQRQAEENIEIWKIKKLIKSLQLARGCAKKEKPAAAPLSTAFQAQDAASSAPGWPAWQPAAQFSAQASGCGPQAAPECLTESALGSSLPAGQFLCEELLAALSPSLSRCADDTTILFASRSNGTSMISLILPPKSQVSMAAKMLADEFGTASNIKSRVNRLSVLSAITSTQQRLKLFTRVRARHHARPAEAGGSARRALHMRAHTSRATAATAATRRRSAACQPQKPRQQRQQRAASSSGQQHPVPKPLPVATARSRVAAGSSAQHPAAASGSEQQEQQQRQEQ
jgi:hypothetical protein